MHRHVKGFESNVGLHLQKTEGLCRKEIERTKEHKDVLERLSNIRATYILEKVKALIRQI